MEHPYTILLTGATGFLGQYVLRDLLNEGHRIAAMLRAPLAESSDRLRTLMRDMGEPVEARIEQGQLVLVEGALPDRLPANTWGRTDAVINSAASLQLFSNGNGDPFGTNVNGVKALLEWTRQNDVQTMHAVSTAYTCGWNSGIIKEEFHRLEPKFQTDYERTKWLAESLFEQWSKEPGHTLTVFRPSFLVGDSKTGYTSQFAGFYQFARLVSMLKQQYADPNNGKNTHIPLRIPGRPGDRQNLVPVDFVSRIIAAIVSTPEFHGRIYHLTNPKGPTNDMMKRWYEEYFGLQGGYFADPGEVIGKCSQAESLLWDQYDVFTPRVVHTTEFDISHTREVMAATRTEFPALTPERMYMLFDYAVTRDWGRKTNGSKTR